MTQTHKHKSNVSQLKLLLLCLCIPPELYINYIAEAYAVIPTNPGPVPIYNPNDTQAQHANTKAVWEYNATRYNGCHTMMSSLTDLFLSLIYLTYKSDFENHRINNPNTTFRDCFQWFITRYDEINELDRDENNFRMKRDWTLQDGWDNLHRQIEEDQLYASAKFAQSGMTEQDIVDIALIVIMKTGLFELPENRATAIMAAFQNILECQMYIEEGYSLTSWTIRIWYE